MNNKIDIVVTYVDQNDQIWQKEFIKYKNEELGNNKNTENNTKNRP